MAEKEKVLKTCSYEMSDLKPCGRTLHDDEHCVFHSKDIERKKKGFNDNFWKEFERQKKDESLTVYDFRGFVFPDYISFDKIKFGKDVYFWSATFSGKANFRLATFSGKASFQAATFSGKADFQAATFSGEADFLRATFSGLADFRSATFSGEADFGAAKFSGGAHFGFAKFSGKASFGLATFSWGADFGSATLEHDALFNNIVCSAFLRFQKTKFYALVEYPGDSLNPVNFSLSKFKDTLDLNEAEFGVSESLLNKIRELSPEEIKKLSSNEIKNRFGLSQRSVIKLKNLKPDQINIGCVSFEGAEVSGVAIFNQIQIHLKKVDFREVKFNKKLELKIEYKYLEKIAMVETFIYDLMGDNGRLGLKSKKGDTPLRGLVEGLDHRNDNQKYLKRNWPFINLHEIRKRFVKRIFPYEPKYYRYLSENFTPILGEQAEARYPIAAREIKDDRFLMRFKIKHKIWFFLWWLFADCGRSFLRWAAWSLGIVFIFALIFNNFYQDYNLNFHSVYITQEYPFLSFLYYSMVTFTTLGFGDIVPSNGWLQFWVALEVAIGYIMLGGLISILANKLARRS